MLQVLCMLYRIYDLGELASVYQCIIQYLYEVDWTLV